VAFALSALAACAGGTTSSHEKPLVTSGAETGTHGRALDLAEKAIEEKRYDDAVKMAQRVLIDDPGNLRANLIQAEARLGDGQPKKAISTFKKIAEASEVPPALVARAEQGQGLSLIFEGQRTKARQHLQKAVSLDPLLWRAWNGLGYLHDREGEWGKSEFAYEQALAENPDSASILNNRGFSRLMQGEIDPALEDLERAIRLNPDLEIAETNMRLALAAKGAYVNAMSGVSDAERGEVLNNIGYMALVRGDYESAEAYFLRAMESDVSFNKIAHRNLAYLKTLRQPDTAELTKSERQEGAVE
jgi:Flp pilus assembly protein TadD